MKSILMQWLVFFSLLTIVVSATPATAQSAKLRQQINQIECVYTSTDTGWEVAGNSICDGRSAPKVTDVWVNDGRPIITGTYSASTLKGLRVWINSQWFTLGIDNRLQASDGVWVLDLSDLASPLPVGAYIIAIEEETTNSLLLSNSMAGIFVVESASAPATPVGAPIVDSSGLEFLDRPYSPFPHLAAPIELPVDEPVDELPEYALTPGAPFVDHGASQQDASQGEGLSTIEAVAATTAVTVTAGTGGAVLWRKWYIRRP